MGLFSIIFRESLSSQDPKIAASSVLNELDSLTTRISGWAERQHKEDGTHDFQPSGFDLVPVGGIIQWHLGRTVPTGWLLCDNSVISRTTYPLLFKAIGITYGAGNGTTTFSLPNLNTGTPKYIILACA